jgi:enamine deaminase RidA (YjgF/YER057c/UK114 family)
MKSIALVSCLLSLACQAPPPPSSTRASGAGEVAADFDPDAKLAALGITLRQPPSPAANYVNAVRTGNLLFLAGKGPTKPDGGLVTGKVGIDLDLDQGYQAARLVGINQLAVLKAELGSLGRVQRIVKVLGMVQCGPDFANQPEVMNGYSDLMVEVFGERGKHARSSIGVNALPRHIAVEVEMIVEVR